MKKSNYILFDGIEKMRYEEMKEPIEYEWREESLNNIFHYSDTRDEIFNDSWVVQ